MWGGDGDSAPYQWEGKIGAAARAGLNQGSPFGNALVRNTSSVLLGRALSPAALCDPGGGLSVLSLSIFSRNLCTISHVALGITSSGAQGGGALHSLQKSW